MKCFGISDKGIIRTDNQDAFAIEQIQSKGSAVAVLCDGMGGQNAGALASRMSVKCFTEYVVSKLTSRINKNPDIGKILVDACLEANKIAFDYSKFDKNFDGMGTTLVGAVISKAGSVNIVNVGDSRCYYINKKEITQITTDHSLVEDLVRSGAITKEQAKTHKQRSIITKAIGSEESVAPDLFELKLNKGDMLLLCSDGLTNYVSDEYIHECFLNTKDPEGFCTMLLNQTYNNGAGDNVTMISVIY